MSCCLSRDNVLVCFPECFATVRFFKKMLRCVCLFSLVAVLCSSTCAARPIGQDQSCSSTACTTQGLAFHHQQQNERTPITVELSSSQATASSLHTHKGLLSKEAAIWVYSLSKGLLVSPLSLYGITAIEAIALYLLWIMWRSRRARVISEGMPSCSTEAMPPCDWDRGLKDVLPHIAKGRSAMKAMRRVSKTWKEGFDASVTRLRIDVSVRDVKDSSPFLPRNFSERFLKVTSLDIGSSLTPQKHLARLSGLKELKFLTLGIPQRCRGSWQHSCLANRLSVAGLMHIASEQLAHLGLSGCKSLGDNVLEKFQSLPLTSLDLSEWESLDGPGLRFLRSISSLKSLDLRACTRLRDLTGLLNLQLTSLNLKHCSGIVRDADFAPLLGMPLTFLDLSFARLSGIRSEGLKFLEGMPLGTLNLDSSLKLGNVLGLQPVLEMPLTYLNLSGCQMVGANLQFLQGLPLSKLIMNKFEFEDADLRALRGLQLTHLELKRGGVNQLTGEGLQYLVGMPLQKLNLRGWSRLSGESLGHIDGMPIVFLEFDGRSLSNDGRLTVLASLPHLECLSIGSSCILPSMVEERLLGRGVTIGVHHQTTF